MRRSLLVLAALALLAGMLTACGEDEADAAALVRDSPQTTADAGSARVTYAAVISGMPGADEIEFGGDGVIDFESDTGRLELTLPTVPGLPPGATLETVFDGLVSYQRSEAFGPLPGGADWIVIDMADLLEDEAGIDVEQLPTYGSDPSASLALLEAVSEDGLEEVGEDEVGGVTATHYRAEVDVAEQYEDNDAITDPEAFEMFRSLLGDEPVDVDVWIDDEGRVVRQRFDQPLPFAGGEDAVMAVTVELSDFGTDVDVELPEADETIDVRELDAGA